MRLGALLIFEWTGEAQAGTARLVDGSMAQRGSSGSKVTLGGPDQAGKRQGGPSSGFGALGAEEHWVKVSRGLARGWLYKNGYGCGGAIGVVGRQCRMVWDGQAVLIAVRYQI